MHKQRPADYGLTPPSSPRPSKTLCDAGGEVSKDSAQRLLEEGFRRGMVSRQSWNGWQQNIWSVDESGSIFEAQLENREMGTYHGYPMPQEDQFRETVLKEWDKRG